MKDLDHVKAAINKLIQDAHAIGIQAAEIRTAIEHIQIKRAVTIAPPDPIVLPTITEDDPE